jgi:raffinose/stachyose/melibiose transport system substrate-binding protein
MNTAPNEAALKKQVSDIDTGKTEITIKWFKDMAQKYADLRDAGCFPANPKSVTEVDGNTLFATGKSPILPTGTFSMGSVRNLNPAMKGNMGVLGMNWTNDVNATYTGITNNPFIMGINKAAGKTEQKIARAFLSYLLQGEVAEYYAKSSAQHVTVLGVQYDDVDLRNTQTIMSERLILAPRFIFLNKAVSDAAEAALIEIVGGEGVDKALEDGAKKIKQILNK